MKIKFLLTNIIILIILLIPFSSFAKDVADDKVAYQTGETTTTEKVGTQTDFKTDNGNVQGKIDDKGNADVTITRTKDTPASDDGGSGGSTSTSSRNGNGGGNGNSGNSSPNESKDPIGDPIVTREAQPKEYIWFNEKFMHYNWYFTNKNSGRGFDRESPSDTIHEQFNEAGKWHAKSLPEYHYDEGYRQRDKITTVINYRITHTKHRTVTKTRTVTEPAKYNWFEKIVNGVKELVGVKVKDEETREEQYEDTETYYEYTYTSETTISYSPYVYTKVGVNTPTGDILYEDKSQQKDFDFTISVLDINKTVKFPVYQEVEVRSKIELVQ